MVDTGEDGGPFEANEAQLANGSGDTINNGASAMGFVQNHLIRELDAFVLSEWRMHYDVSQDTDAR